MKKTTRFLALVMGLILLISFAGCKPDSNDTDDESALLCAMTINGTEISRAEVNYYYNLMIREFIDYYGEELLNYGIDPGKPMAEQDYDGSMTWGQAFSEESIASLTQIVAISDAATQAAFQLPQSYIDIVDTMMDELHAAAEQAEKTVNQLLRDDYGPGMTVELYEAIQRREYLSIAYREHLENSYTVNEEDIDNEYSENKNYYDNVNCRAYIILCPTQEGEITEEELEATKSRAEEFARLSESEEKYIENTRLFAETDEDKEYYEDDDATMNIGLTVDDLGDQSLEFEWLFDPARAEGDVGIIPIENDAGFFVLYFISRQRDETKTVNVRHMLAAATLGTDDSDLTDDPEALALAEGWLAEFEETDRTSAAFGRLADKYTDDGGSKGKGGMYKGVKPGAMVPNFDAWIFDSARKPGDTGIVATQFGYHVIYFDSEGLLFWKADIENTMRTNYITDYTNDLLQTVETELVDEQMELVEQYYFLIIEQPEESGESGGN